MAEPDDPAAEARRLASLRATGLLDTPPEEAFDRLTRLACRVLAAPTALVSLVGAGRQFFKSAHGFSVEPFASARGTPLSHSFCRHVVEGGAPLLVSDARHHPLVRANPAVRDLGVVAYLGVPLHAGDGVPIGALCVLDAAPRAWRTDDLMTLRDLAGLAVTEFALRRETAGREEALRQVRQSATRYRAIVEDQTELVCRYLPDTRLTFVNGAYARHFGRPAAALVGTRFVELVPPEARPAILAHVAALRPGEPTTSEHEVLLPDGSVGWQQWTDRAITDEAGTVVEYQAVGHDITGRKRLELELAEAKRRLDDALDSMSDGFALFGPDDRLVYRNRRYLDFFPRTAALRVPGARIDELRREAARLGDFEDVGEPESWSAEQAAVYRDGGEGEHRLAGGRCASAAVRKTGDGGTVVVWRDITEGKRLERELAAAKRRLDDALECMAETFVLFGADGRLVLCNGRYRDLNPAIGDLIAPGVSRETLAREAVRRGQYKGVGPGDLDAWLAGRAEAYRRGSADDDFELADGRHVHVTLRPTSDGGVIGVGRDVTERKRLELELATAKRRLDDAVASMSDGLVLYDAGERVVLCNEQHRRLFPASADLRVPGASVREIWHEEVRRGVYKGVDLATCDAWIAERRARSMAEGREEVELADGRCLEFRVAPTAEGGTIVVARDVTEAHRAGDALRHAAGHDPLTDLPNRRTFEAELRRAHARVAREGGRLAVVLVDLDGFKAVNDRHGHAAGDALLAEVARRLAGCTRAGDLVARLGGDEFAILSEGGSGEAGDGFAALADRLVAAVRAPADLGGVRFQPGASVGLTVFPADPGGPDELVAHADAALYAAKAAGRGAWRAWERPGGNPAGRAGAEPALSLAPAPG